MAAKDGSNRGGKRAGAGRKKKPLAEKIQEGQKAIALAMPESDNLDGAEVDDIKEFLSEEQRIGDLYGREIWDQMVSWLRERNCAHLISPHLLEQYSMAMARWIQLERINNEMGFLSKHPTTGAAITSPFVTMAQGYLKQANVLFQQIFSIVSVSSQVNHKSHSNAKTTNYESLSRVAKSVYWMKKMVILTASIMHW